MTEAHPTASDPTAADRLEAGVADLQVPEPMAAAESLLLKLGLALPAIGSPLFIVSNPDLVIAQCCAGIVGSFPALNARPAPVLEDWLVRIKDALAEHDARHPDRPLVLKIRQQKDKADFSPKQLRHQLPSRHQK